MTITEFLTARYDEREAAARASETKVWASTVAEQAHIALNDPAYVLADIAAKRAIVELHGTSVGMDAVLDLLAQPFAEHADFDPAWRV